MMHVRNQNRGLTFFFDLLERVLSRNGEKIGLSPFFAVLCLAFALGACATPPMGPEPEPDNDPATTPQLAGDDIREGTYNRQVVTLWQEATAEMEAGDYTRAGVRMEQAIRIAPGEPVLISWDDAETYFHEFGHALHYLSSNVAYPTLNGGVRDYTEFQSQLLERWLLTDEVIDNYLVHYETGEPIPAELVAKIKKAATFNEGFKTTEYLASALMDLRYHTTDPTGLDPDAFERTTLQALSMPTELVMRHRSPHFGHVFSGEGYATGYYGYLWADVLTADAAEAFAEAPGGFYDEAVSGRLVEFLFAPRNALDPAEAYRLFRGRDADIKALMRDRGFPVSE